MRLTRLFAGIAVWMMVTGVMAQDLPTPQEPEVRGDIAQDTAGIIDIYADGYSTGTIADLFSPGASLFIAGAPQTFVGSQAVEQALTDLHNVAFTNVEIDPSTYIITDNTVVVEYVFRGTNTSSLFGAPPSNLPVEVPMVAVYDVAGEEITGARVYYDAADMITGETLNTDAAVSNSAELAAEPISNEVEVSLLDDQIDMPTELPSGIMTFIITNDTAETYQVQIDGQGAEAVLDQALPPGEMGLITLDLQPGTYTVHTIPDGETEPQISLDLLITDAVG